MTAITEGPVIGQECKLQYNTATNASPSWTVVTRAINVDVSMPLGEAEIASRQSAFKYKKGTLREIEITFTYQKKAGTDAVFDALQAAALANTVYQWWVTDGTNTLTGAQGPKAFCQIFDMSLGQELENTEEVEFVLKATHTEESATLIEPTWAET